MLTAIQIKKIKSLKDKKERLAQKLFVVEGEKSVLELLSSGFKIQFVYALPDWINEAEPDLKKKWSDVIFEITENELSRISHLKKPNKVIALAHLPDEKTRENIFTDQPILAFEDISDPGNLGSIIRIADWFGIKTILCSENSVDAFNPKVVQATMGSLFRVNVIYGNLFTIFQKLKDEAHFKIYATTLTGKSIYTAEKPTNAVLVFGNESRGISSEILNLTDAEITIPAYAVQKKKLSAESLNIAMATAITCNEWRRKH